MGGDWRTTTLGEALAFQRGHDLPEQNRRAGRVPIMGSAGLTGWHDEAIALGPGVTIGRSGASAGVVSYVREDYWPHNTCLYVTDFKGNDPRFCYYWLSTLNLAGFSGGSAQPSLNRNHLYVVAVRLPSPLEQHSIANLLGALDDKIELNRRMLETLEAMVRALFKSWFVDFDPVRAKADGQPTGLPDKTAALFPDRLGSDGLPAGWAWSALRAVLSNVVQRTQPSDATAKLPYVPIDAIRAKTLCDLDWQPGKNAQSSLVSFSCDDILFGAMRPYFHKVALAPFHGLTRTTVFVLRPANAGDLCFALLLMSEDQTIAYATSGSSGSTIPYATWDNALAEMPLALPPTPLRFAFGDVALPMLRRAQGLAMESRTLAALRDTLLPKLISGELRIADAERAVAAA